MQKSSMIVLFGSSLLMDTVEASLAQNQSLKLVRIQADDVDWWRCISVLSPDLVIFDWGSPCSQALSMLRDQPGLPLIGLDATTNSVIALSSRQYTPVNANELAKLIRAQSSGPR